MEYFIIGGALSSAKYEDGMVWYQQAAGGSSGQPAGFYTFDATEPMPEGALASATGCTDWALSARNVVCLGFNSFKILDREGDSLSEPTVVEMPPSILIGSLPVFSRPEGDLIYFALVSGPGGDVPLQALNVRDQLFSVVSCGRRSIRYLTTSETHIYWHEDRRSLEESANNGIYRIARP